MKLLEYGGGQDGATSRLSPFVFQYPYKDTDWKRTSLVGHTVSEKILSSPRKFP